MQKFQGANIAAHINAGGELHSSGRSLAVGIVSLIITFTVGFIILFMIDYGKATDTIKTYGVMKHSIVFDKNNISENDVNKIAEGLTKTNYFDESSTKYVYVKKVNDSFEISISFIDPVENNPEVIKYYVQLRNELQFATK